NCFLRCSRLTFRAFQPNSPIICVSWLRPLHKDTDMQAFLHAAYCFLCHEETIIPSSFRVIPASCAQDERPCIRTFPTTSPLALKISCAVCAMLCDTLAMASSRLKNRWFCLSLL